MLKTATGTITRVQLRRDGQYVVPHGNLLSYDPATGNFEALFDFQKEGEEPYKFTQLTSTDSREAVGSFEDQFGNIWFLVR